MIRKSLWCVVALGALTGPVLAQTDKDADKIREAGQAQYDTYTELANAEMASARELRTQADNTTDPTEKTRLLQEAQQHNEKALEYLNQAKQTSAETAGMIGRMNEVEARIERDKERYDKPGFWDKVGDKSVDIIGDLLSNLLQQWIAGGGQDDDLLNEINRLREERDNLLNNDPNADGVGRIITDPNGNYGYDRDGDGFVDIPLNPDGSLAGPYNPTNPDAYNGGNGGLAAGIEDEDADDADGLSGLPGFGGGGASFGGSGGPNFGGGAGGIGGATGGDPLAGGEETPGGFPGAEDGVKDMDGDGDIDADDIAAARKARDKNGDGIPDDEQLETVMGRLVILPKLEFEKEVAGDHEEGGDWSDDFEEWGDDDWDDSSDNGDKTFSEEDWAKDGEKPVDGKVGDAEEEAKLVDELIRVETVIQEWRTEAEEEAGETEDEDPYFKEDDELSGYRAAGDEEPKKDPFKDVRDEDGKIDLSKVDIWVIDRDSWKDGKKPIRYKVEISDEDELKDFEPIHGGVLVARGMIEDLEVKESVMKTIKGEVKKVTLHKVILSAEKPPEDMESLDPDANIEDSDVGGLDESEKADAPSTKKGSKSDDDFDDFDDSDW